MRRSALVASLVVVLLLSSLVATPAAASPQHDETVIEIQVQPNGDAVWTIAMRYNLSSENETAAFDRLRSEYEAGNADVGPEVAVFREAASQVAAETDRDMAITEVARSSDLEVRNDSQVGVLELTFRWTSFATVDGDRISVQTAFTGGWFGDLAAGQTLLIEPPEGYRVQTASPSTAIIGGALRWEGPQAFGPDEPTVEFRPPSTSPPPPTTTPPQIGIPWTYAVIAFGGLVVGGLVLLAWQGGYLGGPASSDEDEPPAGGGVESGSQATADATDSTAQTVESDEAAGAAAAAGETDEDTDEEPVDMELLSDEERVEHILEGHGGRMKQAQIVEETRWSNAKVSQLLSSMAEEGRVEKLRIGRENLISLPDYDDE